MPHSNISSEYMFYGIYTVSILVLKRPCPSYKLGKYIQNSNVSKIHYVFEKIGILKYLKERYE